MQVELLSLLFAARLVSLLLLLLLHRFSSRLASSRKQLTRSPAQLMHAHHLQRRFLCPLLATAFAFTAIDMAVGWLVIIARCFHYACSNHCRHQLATLIITHTHTHTRIKHSDTNTNRTSQSYTAIQNCARRDVACANHHFAGTIQSRANGRNGHFGRFGRLSCVLTSSVRSFWFLFSFSFWFSFVPKIRD